MDSLGTRIGTYRESYILYFVVEVIKASVIIAPLIWGAKFLYDYWLIRLNRISLPPARVIVPKADTVPLPRKRQRALTNPLPPLSFSDGVIYSIRRYMQRTDQQAKSTFFTRLPSEIRQMIYYELFTDGGNRVIHLALHEAKQAMSYSRCETQDPRASCCDEYMALCHYAPPGDRENYGVDFTREPWVLAMLQSCRLIYSETIQLLYSRNVFYFYKHQYLHTFTRMIRPQRLQLIKSVVVRYKLDHTLTEEDWTDTWATIIEMRGLLELRIIFESLPRIGFEEFFHPMMQVRGLKVFELMVSNSNQQFWERPFPKDGPFKVLPFSRE